MGQCKSILVVLGHFGQQWPVTVGKKDPMAPQRGVSPRTPKRRVPVLATPERRSGPMERPDPADHVGDVEGSNSPIVPPALAFPLEIVGGSNDNPPGLGLIPLTGNRRDTKYPPGQICTTTYSKDRSVRKCHQIQGARETVHFWLTFLVASVSLSGTLVGLLIWFRSWLRARGAGGNREDVEAGRDGGDGGDGGDGVVLRRPSFFR